MRVLSVSAIALALLVPLQALALPPGTSKLVAEAMELAAKRSGRVVATTAEREAVEATLEASIAKYGRTAVSAAGDGGLELLEAARAHGPEVIDLAAHVSPPARRVLALEADRMLPLARRVGPEALELEVKAPGMAQRVVDEFGVEGARKIAAQAPAEDIPRLLLYSEKATTPEAKKLLLARYLEEGSVLFTRVRAADVLAQGLSEAMLLGGIAAVASQVMPYLSAILWALAVLAVVGLLYELFRTRASA